MKGSKWLVVALCLWALPSQAQSPHSTHLSNLDFYPHAHEFEFNLHEQTTFSDQTLTNTGALSRIGYDEFYSAFRFGLEDGWRVAVADTILWDQTNDSFAASGTESVTTSAGPSNPTLTVSKRAIESETSGFAFDVAFSLSPAFGPKVNADTATAKTGNNANGGTVGTLTTSVYWQSAVNEVATVIGISDTSASTTETASNGDTRTGSFFSTTITVSDRWHLDEQRFCQLDFEMDLPSAKDSTTAGGVVTRSEAATSGAATVTYGYLPEANNLLEFQIEDRTSYAKSFTTAGATSSRTGIVAGTVAFLHSF